MKATAEEPVVAQSGGLFVRPCAMIERHCRMIVAFHFVIPLLPHSRVALTKSLIQPSLPKTQHLPTASTGVFNQ